MKAYLVAYALLINSNNFELMQTEINENYKVVYIYICKYVCIVYFCILQHRITIILLFYWRANAIEKHSERVK